MQHYLPAQVNWRQNIPHPIIMSSQCVKFDLNWFNQYSCEHGWKQTQPRFDFIVARAVWWIIFAPASQGLCVTNLHKLEPLTSVNVCGMVQTMSRILNEWLSDGGLNDNGDAINWLDWIAMKALVRQNTYFFLCCCCAVFPAVDDDCAVTDHDVDASCQRAPYHPIHCPAYQHWPHCFCDDRISPFS